MYWQRVLEFAEVSDKMAVALKVVHDMQESKLFKLGLSRNINAAMPIFALKNVAGWRDKVDLIHGGALDIETKGDPYKILAENLVKLGIVLTREHDGQASNNGGGHGPQSRMAQIPR